MSWLVNSCRITYVWSTSFPRGHPRFTIAYDSKYKFPYMVNLLQCRTDSQFVSIYVSLCWVEIILALEKAFWINYTDNHVSFESILLSLLCHTTVGDHLFPDQSGKSFGIGLWRTQKTMNILFNWSDRRWPETKRGEDKGEEGGKITSFRPIFKNESSAFVT